MRISNNNQKQMNSGLGTNYQNRLNYDNTNNSYASRYQNGIKEQSQNHQAPIKRFVKSNQQNPQITSYKNNNTNLFNYTIDKKYELINFSESNNKKQINNINMNYILNNNYIINKNENKKSHHQQHVIDMTTKKIHQDNCIKQDGYYRNINRDNYIINVLNNNNDNNYFRESLRNYNYNKKERNSINNVPISNQQKQRIYKNHISNNHFNDNKQVKNNQKVKDNTAKSIKTNNFRNSTVLTKNLMKYSNININKSDLKNLSQKHKENIYVKKTQNITNKNRQRNIFNNCIIVKNDDFNVIKENKIKRFDVLDGKNNEYFVLKAKEKKKILKQKLIEFFALKGKEKTITKFTQEKIEHLLLEGKKKNLNNMKTNEKIKEILELMDKFNLNDDEKKSIIIKLTSSLEESNKQKKNKQNENDQKNANDNISLETNNSSSKEKPNKKIKKENESKRKNKKKDNDNIIKEETKRDQKIYGFINVGNNCYMNSSLQLLTRIKELKQEVFNFNENYQDNDTQGKLIIEFRKILTAIERSYNDNLIINPGNLKRIMGNVDEKYYSSGQEDSNEFISNFINALLSETGNKEKKVNKLNIINESEKRPYENLYKKFFQRKGDSFIYNLFYGITKLTKFCKNCGKNISIKFNVYNMLEFPLYNLVKNNSNKELTLLELYNDFVKETKCEGECDNCNNDDIYSKTTIYTLPKYLMICLQRTCDRDYFYNNVTYPKNLKMKSEFDNNINCYMLDCVIQHSGGTYGGHYTALVPFDNDNNKWMRFSDSSWDDNYSEFQSRNAFILLYKLK